MNHRLGPDGWTLAGRERALLTPEQAVEARRALAAGRTTRETAELLGIPYRRLRDRLRDQLQLRLGRGRVRRGIRRAPFPTLTEQEIRERTAEVRRAWPLERWLGHAPDDGRRDPRWPR